MFVVIHGRFDPDGKQAKSRSFESGFGVLAGRVGFVRVVSDLLTLLVVFYSFGYWFGDLSWVQLYVCLYVFCRIPYLVLEVGGCVCWGMGLGLFKVYGTLFVGCD